MEVSITNSSPSRLTGFRLNPTTLARLKTKAKSEKISLNTLVDNILAEDVKDIRSDEEIRESNERTKNFLDSCWGAWEGPEYDGVEDMVVNHKHSKPLVR